MGNNLHKEGTEDSPVRTNHADRVVESSPQVDTLAYGSRDAVARRPPIAIFAEVDAGRIAL